ncbi:MAG: DUF99 family protein [Polyangiaceae bacterium]|nr:DUF99 family protein [Polyangiaceae bacterium]
MNVIGFDDGPFGHAHRGDVLLVGAVCSRTRLDGVVSGRVRRDGHDATRRMIELVTAGPFRAHVRAVFLQGIAVAGFNVVDVHALSRALAVPVLVIVRRLPDLAAVRRALFSTDPPGRPHVRGARRKWRLIEAAGALEPIGPSRRAERRAAPSGRPAPGPRLWIQRVGASVEEARRLLEATTLHGQLPEPIRLAHIIAGGIADGHSRGRA